MLHRIFPAGCGQPSSLSGWPPFYPVHTVVSSPCLSTSRHEVLTTCRDGEEASGVHTAPGSPCGFCQAGAGQSTPSYAGVRRNPGCSFVARPNACLLCGSDWGGHGREQGWPSGLWQDASLSPSPAPHPRPGPSEKETEHSSQRCGSQGWSREQLLGTWN